MNANELADQLESKFIRGSHKQKAADMLRQQQAEIETLRMHGYRTQYELLRIKCIEEQAEIEALRNQLWDLKSEPWGFDRKAQEK